MSLTGPLVETNTIEKPRISVEDAVRTRTAASQPTLEFFDIKAIVTTACGNGVNEIFNAVDGRAGTRTSPGYPRPSTPRLFLGYRAPQ